MRLKLFAFVAAIAVATAVFYIMRPAILPSEEEPEPCIGAACGAGGTSAEEDLAAPPRRLSDRRSHGLQSEGRRLPPVPVEVVLVNGPCALGRDLVKAATAADLYNSARTTT
jgi:hypothetical protein